MDKNWKSFFQSIKDWKKSPSKYLGRPKLPKYKDKIKGRNVVIFTSQQVRIKGNYIKFPKSDHRVKTTVTENLRQVRIIPRPTNYVIEIVYSVEIPEQTIESKNIVSIDLGLNNLVTMTNNIGKESIVVNGKNIKSTNHYYNKKLAKLKSDVGIGTSKRIQKLTLKRNNKVKDYIHKSSRFIVNYCVENKIDTIVIGSNKNWKQSISIGKRNNQNFVQIPYNTLLKQIEYKALKAGIKTIVTEESYTSKASFLDNDTIPIYKQEEKHNFSGSRIHRGLYKTANGILLNADVNGSLNIARKVFLNDLWSDRIEGVVFHPIRVNIT